MWPFRKRRPTTRSARYRDNNPLKKQLLIGGLLVVLVSGLVTSVWYGTRVPAWQIETVRVVGGPTIQHEDVRALVWQQLEGSYFRLVPKTFFYTYPETTIAAVIQDLPRVKAVTTTLTDRSELVVAFEEYIPEALWCRSVEMAGSNCVFFDQTGYAFATAPTLQGGVFIRYVHSVEEPRVDATPFSAEFLTETKTFSTWLIDTFGWYVTHVVSTNGIDVDYTLAHDGILKVTTQVPITTTQNNLETLLAAPEMEKERAGDFEYIDLRFGDKIFIRDVEPEPVATSTEMTATSSEGVVTTSTEEDLSR